MMNVFVVGDLVKIKPEMRDHMIQMKEEQERLYVGKIAKVVGFDTDDDTGEITAYRLDVDGCKYRWHSWMLEKIPQYTKFGVIPQDNQPQKMDNQQSKADLFRKITEDMADLYEKKNHDYGDSFGESWKDFGITGSVIRLGDKYRRLRNLTRDDAKVKDESIEDTLMDLANYSVMTLVEMRRQNEK